MMSNEKVLCCIRTQSSDMILTSDRIILQSLPPKVKVAEHFLFPSISEALFGKHGYALWDDTLEEVLGPGGFLAPAKERQKVINPARITDSIPYSRVSEVRMVRQLDPFVKGEICTKEYSIPFGLDEERFIPFWRLISTLLKGKIVFPDKEEMSKLEYIWVTDLCDYLAEIGFQAKPVNVVRSEPSKGIIKLQGRNIDFIIKDTSFTYYFLDFIVSNIKGKLQSLNLKTKKKGGGVIGIEWKGKDKQLVDTLNRDSDLMQLLLNMKNEEKYRNWAIGSHDVSKKETIKVADQELKVEHFVRIYNATLQYLPTNEFFKAMDKIAYYMRSVAAI